MSGIDENRRISGIAGNRTIPGIDMNRRIEEKLGISYFYFMCNVLVHSQLGIFLYNKKAFRQP